MGLIFGMDARFGINTPLDDVCHAIHRALVEKIRSGSSQSQQERRHGERQLAASLVPGWTRCALWNGLATDQLRQSTTDDACRGFHFGWRHGTKEHLHSEHRRRVQAEGIVWLHSIPICACTCTCAWADIFLKHFAKELDAARRRQHRIVRDELREGRDQFDGCHGNGTRFRLALDDFIARRHEAAILDQRIMQASPRLNYCNKELE
mmetsp:Transcript_17983/g.49883  ORF Transcript_17983/g.49883 Transcript_17983/m.49883 type:complete len:207 (+) Transcript_17983:330-950(+)